MGGLYRLHILSAIGHWRVVREGYDALYSAYQVGRYLALASQEARSPIQAARVRRLQHAFGGELAEASIFALLRDYEEGA